MTLEAARQFKMLWGKHKGCFLGLLPLGYLKWVAKNWTHDTLRMAAEKVYEYRRGLEKKSKLKHKVTEREYREPQTAFGELKELLDRSPEDLF